MQKPLTLSAPFLRKVSKDWKLHWRLWDTDYVSLDLECFEYVCSRRDVTRHFFRRPIGRGRWSTSLQEVRVDVVVGRRF